MHWPKSTETHPLFLSGFIMPTSTSPPRAAACCFFFSVVKCQLGCLIFQSTGSSVHCHSTSDVKPIIICNTKENNSRIQLRPRQAFARRTCNANPQPPAKYMEHARFLLYIVDYSSFGRQIHFRSRMYNRSKHSLNGLSSCISETFHSLSSTSKNSVFAVTPPRPSPTYANRFPL